MTIRRIWRLFPARRFGIRATENRRCGQPGPYNQSSTSAIRRTAHALSKHLYFHTFSIATQIARQRLSIK
jgi:hypothetical protein